MAQKNHEKETEKLDEKGPIFRYLDHFTFNKLNQFLESQTYQKITDKYSELDQNSQKYLNHILTLVLLILPLFFVYKLFVGNHELKNEYQTKQEILSHIHEFRQKKSNVDALSMTLESPVGINSQRDLEDKMASRMRNFNIAREKVRVDDFNFHPVSSELGETTVRIVLRDLTMTELTNFLTIMLGDYKMRSTGIELELDESTELLGGNIEFVHIKRITRDDIES